MRPLVAYPSRTLRSEMPYHIKAFLMLLLFGACNSIRPEARYGPVIDDSRIDSITFYSRGSTGSPPDTLFVRHFRYIRQPAPWSVVSSGASRPVTLFEEMGVYTLTQFGLARLARLPYYHLDGLTQPRIHIVARPPGPIPSGLLFKPRFLVYVEGGPIYGGIDLGAPSLPATISESALRLLVDGQVYRADIGLDGESIVYIDTSYRLYTLVKGAVAPAFILDIKEVLPNAKIHGVRWEPSGQGRIFILLDFGNEFNRVWAVFPNAQSLSPTFSIDPSAATNVPSPDLLNAFDERARTFSYTDWAVPDPASFTE